MKYIFITLLSTVLFSCSVFHHVHKTDWTVAEVQEWSIRNKNTSMWKGMILYQGSDSLSHHFIGRWMDEWTWFNLRKADLQLAEIYPFEKKSKKGLGYYYVDPNQGFKKIADYE